MDVLQLIYEAYGGVAPLVVTRGKRHGYLGTTLDFSTEGAVKIEMKDYVTKMIINLPTEEDQRRPTRCMDGQTRPARCMDAYKEWPTAIQTRFAHN
jgi:hypothetical protein